MTNVKRNAPAEPSKAGSEPALGPAALERQVEAAPGLLGQFVHLLRRNIPMIYIIEDNGVYGLTKGQFTATADKGSVLKYGSINTLEPIDPVTLAIELGCGFVARSFSGNPKQMNAILKAAFAYEGTSIIDIVSPCVTFNNHDSSTKSYKNIKDHEIPLHELGFVAFNELENVELASGE